MVDIQAVDIVFGGNEREALRLLDEGRTRDEVREAAGSVVGVADASVCIDEGEICVLMGLSGSGKSTLLRAINGLNRPTRGRVLVRDGESQVDVAGCDAATLRRLRMERVAMVFQQFALFPWRTVHENVALGLELRGVPRDERDAVVAEKLRLVELDRWAGKYVHELSGGMQQRVGLARAFATDADILLMDEPFSALDPLIRDHLQDELLDLQKTLKKTIVFVSHDLDEALKLGNHIAIMDAGRIVQYGEPERIVLQPANAYVAEFVAHMNTIDVLRGRSLMTPVEELKREGGELVLDWSGRNRLKLTPEGGADGASVGGREVPLIPFAPGDDTARMPCDAMAAAPPDIRMRTAIELRHRTGAPVVFLDGGKVIGVIGDDEIYRGLLRRNTPNEGGRAAVAKRGGAA